MRSAPPLALLLTLVGSCTRAFWPAGGAPDGTVQDGARADTSRDARPGDAPPDAPAPGDLPPAPSGVVFYSVGQDTADHKSGAPTVTISAGLAAFSVPQTADGLGVGDVVDYGADHKRCFLSQKISTTRWRCTTATGGPPDPASAAAVNSISHAFGSLAAAIAGASDSEHLGTSNLVQAGVSLHLPCYNDGGAPDTSRVVVSGYVATSQQRILIYAPTDTDIECNRRQRHTGAWDDTRYRLEVTTLGSTDASLTLRVAHTRVEGLQVLASGASNVDGIQTTGGPAGEYYVSNNIVVGKLTSASANSDGICTHGGSAGQVVYVWNNVVYGFDAGSVQASGLYNGVSGTTLVAYNNTIVGCNRGIQRAQGTVIAKNNLVQANDQGFVGAFDAASTHNLSSFADAPGSGSLSSTTVLFVDAGSQDYHLRPDDPAAGAGADLSGDGTLPFATDIDGDARVAPWDIGADETP
jgi:hypothetical protein